MLYSYGIILQLLVHFLLPCCYFAEVPLYTNDWVVEVLHPGVNPDLLADKHGFVNIGQVGSLENIYHFRRQDVLERSSGTADSHTLRLRSDSQVRWTEQQAIVKRVKRDFVTPADPLWKRQWYLDSNQLGHNVLPVWEQGLTGRGVVVSVVDDGVQYSHPDLQNNYDRNASYSNNNVKFYRSDHGTACAGVISAAKNNDCGVGVAYEAKVGGVRVLEQENVISSFVSVDEAKALSFNTQYVDIYSSSWGPEDDGKTIDGPSQATQRAFENGVIKGRRGCGSIFVWAAGNGGEVEDDCNCDNYASSIYTISVTAATDTDHHAWYAEKCTSTLTTAYSNGGFEGIVSTSLRDMCTVDFGGTSAAAPLVAGIIALSLQANPSLSWRDVQHITVRASRMINSKDTEWITNGAGYHVNRKFGFGLLDAEKAINLAREWTTVPDQHICVVESQASYRQINYGGLELTIDTDGCHDTGNETRYLEHVVSRIDLQSTYRGDISIYLTSPQGTRSQLLHRRPPDNKQMQFRNWPFMSVHHWGENPRGQWKLRIQKSQSNTIAMLNSWVLIFYGTKYPPQYRNQSYPRQMTERKENISPVDGSLHSSYVHMQRIRPRIRKLATMLKTQAPTEAATYGSFHNTAVVVLITLCVACVVILIVILIFVVWKKSKATWIVQPKKVEKKETETVPFMFQSSRLSFDEEESSLSDYS